MNDINLSPSRILVYIYIVRRLELLISTDFSASHFKDSLTCLFPVVHNHMFWTLH